MTPRFFRSHKKEEFKTYKSLQLGRDHKSIRGRQRVQDGGIYRYIGRGNAARPYLKVLKTVYEDALRQCLQEVRREVEEKGVDYDEVADLYRSRVENRVYDLLSKSEAHTFREDAAFQKLHGRKMTAHERAAFQRAGHTVKSSSLRRLMVDQVIDQVQGKCKSSSASLQDAWAAAVGPDFSDETMLERVDPQKGVAYCRSLSSTLAQELRRRRDLPKKLSELLEVKIRRITFY